ncbi:MAG: 16S rRNA (guanine(527)-N(7))-methyltransferase RsmG [Prevotellaceae bacterium]|jgi:16S rRNA (guanine527-N7)-methyltransferase|nr:16S rRNA (guanine(527)-N(7))-methyltransferase RsmG [Prevotellaceae bacterium]
MQEITKYFTNLTDKQLQQFVQLDELYRYWNSRINLISRKDIDQLYLHHILHSLSIAKVTSFKPNTAILDVGTGGGFPGIPLAIMFPECRFHLVDSIGKKIMVVSEVAKALALENVTAEQKRAEELNYRYDFVVSRAVTDLSTFIGWIWKKIIPNGENALPNGILYLKGGDLKEEIKATNIPRNQIEIYDLHTFFKEDFFETKKLIYIQL